MCEPMNPEAPVTATVDVEETAGIFPLWLVCCDVLFAEFARATIQ
jgi:hypothetical protein